MKIHEEYIKETIEDKKTVKMKVKWERVEGIHYCISWRRIKKILEKMSSYQRMSLARKIEIKKFYKGR